MATVANLIDRSLRLLKQIGSGDTASADEYADGLTALNAMLAGWNTEMEMPYYNADETITLTGATSYAVGPTGNLVTTRPATILDSYVVVDSVSYPVRIIDVEEYAAIPSKVETGDLPEVVYVNPTMANLTAYPWPIAPS